MEGILELLKKISMHIVIIKLLLSCIVDGIIYGNFKSLISRRNKIDEDKEQS